MRAAAMPFIDDALRQRTDSLRTDTTQDAIDRAQKAIGEIANRARIERLAQQTASATSVHQRRQLSKQILKALGVDLSGDPGSTQIVDRFIGENISLIKGIASRASTDLEETITRGIASGTSTKEIGVELSKRFGIQSDRAIIIARDQVGKLNGQLNAERQKDLGVTKFIWRTVQDRRVRGTPGGAYPKAKPSHYDRNGVTYSYAKPPNGELPGTPILCRCYAEPVFDDLDL